MNDDTLAGTPDTPTDDTRPAGFALGVTDDVPAPAKPFTIDEVLARARRIERTATICLRADLQGEWDALLDELAGLVTASGELLDAGDDEGALDASTARGRVTQINDRLTVLRRTMAAEMWRVRFRGLPSDEWATFCKKNKPKGDGADHTEFFNLLVAEAAIEPTLTLEQVKALRQVLTKASMESLIAKAWQACTEGGLDVPKLPISLRNLAAQ